MRQPDSIFQRAQRIAMLALVALAACSSKSTEVPDAIVADKMPLDTSAASSAVDASVSREIDAPIPDVAAEIAAGDSTATDARSVDVAAVAPSPEPTEVAAASAGEGWVSLRGFPGVSGDGMHLALMVGDPSAGPLAVRVARIDGSVLLEKPLIEKGEARAEPADPEHEATLRRRIRARATAAQRVLAKANMHSLTRVATQSEGGTTVVSGQDQISVTLPGYVSGHYPRGVLDRGCATPPRISAVYTDGEHGLVVTSFAHDPSPTCAAGDDWHIFALTALP